MIYLVLLAAVGGILIVLLDFVSIPNTSSVCIRAELPSFLELGTPFDMSFTLRGCKKAAHGAVIFVPGLQEIVIYPENQLKFIPGKEFKASKIIVKGITPQMLGSESISEARLYFRSDLDTLYENL